MHKNTVLCQPLDPVVRTDKVCGLRHLDGIDVAVEHPVTGNCEILHCSALTFLFLQIDVCRIDSGDTGSAARLAHIEADALLIPSLIFGNVIALTLACRVVVISGLLDRMV